MKNILRLSGLIGMLLMTSSLFAQKKWIVEYNKLDNTYNYFEVLTTKGKETEIKLSKVPAVDYGDVVKFRVTNLNEYVFSVKMEEATVISKQANTSSIVSTMTGMLSPLGFVGNMGKSLDFIDRLPSVQGILTRGGDEYAQERNEVLSLNEELSGLLDFASEIESTTSILYAEDLTLNEIKNKFSENVKQVDLGLYQQRQQEFVDHLEKLNSDEVREKLKQAKLESKLNDINSVYLKFSETYEGENSPIDFNRINKDLSKRTFSVERSVVISQDMGRKESGTESFVLFNIRFEADQKPKQVSQESSYGNSNEEFTSKEGNTLRSNIIVELPMKGVIIPKLTTGVIGVKSFGGIPRYIFTNVNSSFGSDSISISRSFDTNVKLAIGTMLNFNLSTKRNLIPSIGFGVSYSFTKGSSDNLGLLLGGSLGLKNFPYLSLSYGLNFQQTKVLMSDYPLNTPILNSSFDLDSYYETKFKPGMFIGLNIQF